MPAARHASRSSAWALAVSASMRVGAVAPPCDFGGADAAGGFQPVHARHLHVHQYQVVRLSGCARGGPGFHRRFAVAGDGRAMAEPRQQRAREQRVDLVVLGDQDRQAFAGRRWRLACRRQFPPACPRTPSSTVSRAASEAARTGLIR